MRRIVATFGDDDDETTARSALRDANLEPKDPEIDDLFFDPSTTMPEGRGLLWGGLIGGLVGAALLFGLEEYVFWVPRISPIMTAGRYELVLLGFGLGVAVGGFLGGVIGTYRRPPEPEQPRLAVVVPDRRVREVKRLLRDHGATAVDGAATRHEHP